MLLVEKSPVTVVGLVGGLQPAARVDQRAVLVEDKSGVALRGVVQQVRHAGPRVRHRFAAQLQLDRLASGRQHATRAAEVSSPFHGRLRGRNKQPESEDEHTQPTSWPRQHLAVIRRTTGVALLFPVSRRLTTRSVNAAVLNRC